MSVDCHSSSEWIYPTRDPYEKPNQWYKHVAKLRQKALDTAREAGADYLLVRLILLTLFKTTHIRNEF